MSIDMHTEWLNSTGGPLILLERSLLPSWGGNLEMSELQAEDNDAQITDYDRACSVEDYVGLIGVGSGQALVLGDEPMQTAWLSEQSNTGILVRWHWATNEDSVDEALSSIPSNIWEPNDVNLYLPHGDLILFDSSCRFDEIDSSISIRLETGTYNVHTAQYQPNENVSLLLHRLAIKVN